MLNDDVSNRAASLESYRERITNFSNEFDLPLFLYIFRRSILWVVLCVVLAFSAAEIYLHYTAPTFQSKATIQISETNNAQKVLKVSDLVENSDLAADVALLRSKFFLAKAI